MPYLSTEVYVDLDDFDDDELADELESRGHKVLFKGDENDEEDSRLKDELFEVLKSWICDEEKVFDKNMRIFSDRWYKELQQ